MGWIEKEAAPSARMRARICTLMVIASMAAVSSRAQDHSAHIAMAKAGNGMPATEHVDVINVPDASLVDQDGTPVKFYSDLVKDKVVIMNFIFTTCTTICPPMGANFSRLQDQLGDRAGKDVFLISVSVDPVVDTPQRLDAWSKKFHRGPGWSLVTGPKSEIDKVLKALKVFTPDKNLHSPTVLMGDESRGEWTRAYGLAAPEYLMQILDGLSDGSAHETQGGGQDR